MTQESEILYRSNLESVCEFLKKRYKDERRALNISDVSAYTGQCYRTVKNKYFKSGYTMITAENFARYLARM